MGKPLGDEALPEPHRTFWKLVLGIPDLADLS